MKGVFLHSNIELPQHVFDGGNLTWRFFVVIIWTIAKNPGYYMDTISVHETRDVSARRLSVDEEMAQGRRWRYTSVACGHVGMMEGFNNIEAMLFVTNRIYDFTPVSFFVFFNGIPNFRIMVLHGGGPRSLHGIYIYYIMFVFFWSGIIFPGH